MTSQIKYGYGPFGPFFASFSGSGPSGRQGPPRKPKLTILAPKMKPQSSKNHWFLIDFWSQDLSKMEQFWKPKSFQNQSKNFIILKQTSNWARLYPKRSTSKRCCGGVPRSVLDRPQTLQKAIKNPTKILIEFWIDFLVILAPFWDPFGPPLGSQIA